jgi:hypothetical protein
MTAYDFSAYEEAMFFHNRYARSNRFKDALRLFPDFVGDDRKAYCPCFDCLSELAALRDYARLAKRIPASAMVGGSDLDAVVRTMPPMPAALPVVPWAP